nr:hypothetical protein [uncultured Romboutsia sp.]
MVNISKVLTINLILFTFLSTGCSSKGVDSIKATQDEAIYQKTMTKVQNNVNEIIGKEYEYVLENMGHPYCTTYYIDIDKVNDINSIEEFNSIEDIRLIYPKEANVNKSKDSALYIQINNNIVKEVQTYELLSNSEKENIKSSVDIIVDIYNENYSLSSDKFENLDLNKYIEEEIELFLKDIGNVKVNFDIYDNKREKNIKVYLLNEVNSSNNKVMLVYNKLNKIEDIKIVDINNGLNLLNYYSYFK